LNKLTYSVVLFGIEVFVEYSHNEQDWPSRARIIEI
jgi:hypothetical protein